MNYKTFLNVSKHKWSCVQYFHHLAPCSTPCVAMYTLHNCKILIIVPVHFWLTANGPYLNSPVHRNTPHAHIGTVSLHVHLTQFCKFPVNHQFPHFTTDYSRCSCCAPTVNNACLLGKGHMESHLTVHIYSWGHDISLRKVARAFLIWKVAEKDPFGLCHLWNVNGSIDITTTTYNLRLGVFH